MSTDDPDEPAASAKAELEAVRAKSRRLNQLLTAEVDRLYDRLVLTESTLTETIRCREQDHAAAVARAEEAEATAERWRITSIKKGAAIESARLRQQQAEKHRDLARADVERLRRALETYGVAYSSAERECAELRSRDEDPALPPDAQQLAELHPFPWRGEAHPDGDGAPCATLEDAGGNPVDLDVPVVATAVASAMNARYHKR